MDRNTLWRLGTALPLVLSCIGLADCSGTNDTTTAALPPTAIAAKRYTALGQPDAGFSGGAVFTKIDPSEFEYALAAALQSGKIIAAGHSVLAGQGVIALVRYNADGSLDTGFGSSGIVRTAVPSVNAVATAVVVQPGAPPAADKILVAGSTFDPSTGTTGIVLARYTANGTLDASFAGGFVSAPIGPGTSVDNASLALQGDGSIVVAGATTAGDFVLRRYDSNGVLDTANFGTNGTGGTVTTHVGPSAMGPAIALQSGKIVAAGASGSFASPPLNGVLVRYNTNGTLDLTFGGGTGMVFTDTVPSSNNFANAVAVQTPGDKIFVAGHAFVDFAADTSDIIVLRYNADGTPDTGFGTNGAVVTDLGAFDNAFSIALQPTVSDPNVVNIVVSGNTGSGIGIRAAVLRFTPGGALDPAFGTGGIVTTSPTGPSTAASANAVLVQPDRSIVVVGYD
ncbi:MAG TPA: hypothetical protein VKC15_20525 [Gemmatimonadales bacterium]|nr:hypothetical protein [Gemmatimonadales bacterium]